MTAPEVHAVPEDVPESNNLEGDSTEITTQPGVPMDDDDEEEEARLDYELFLIQRMNLAFRSSLQMFECALDSLDELGKRVDQVTESSRRCREALTAKHAAPKD